MCFYEVLHQYCCPDSFVTYAGHVRQTFFIGEVRTAYKLLGAQPYAELLERVIRISAERSWPITALKQESARWQRKKEEANLKTGTPAFADYLDRGMKLHGERARLEAERQQMWAEMTNTFKVLLKSPKAKIERYIEAYVAAHPSEFFLD